MSQLPSVKARRAYIDQKKRIDEALARGAVLRFTGAAFEEAGRARGQGPVYPALEVLRRVRVGVALAITRCSDDVGFEVEVRAAPRRSTEALGGRA